MVQVKIFVARTKIVFRVLGLWSLGVVAGASFVFCSIEGREIVDALSYPKTHTIVVKQALANNVLLEAEKPAEAIIWNLGEFSAYTSAEDETDANGSIMASGKTVYNGAIACPSFLKFGERVEVKGFGVFTCEDRMNIRYRDTNHFDIYHDTKQEAFSFGRKQLEWRAL